MRRLTLVTITALFLFLAIGVAPAAAFDRSASEARMLRLINHAREARGLKPVERVTRLDRAALSHSRDMILYDYFAHSSLSRTSTRWKIGEVIAWGKGYRGTPESIFRVWMKSGTHRSIILGSGWRDVGIGASRGTYSGISGVVMYTVDFGRLR